MLHSYRVAGAWIVGALFSCVASAQVQYEPVDILRPRIGHQMVSAAGGVLMTGGNQGGSASQDSDIHEFRNGAWHTVGQLWTPAAFTDSAFDPGRQVLLGLVDQGGGGMTLVEWNGVTASYVNNVPLSLFFAEQQQIVFDPFRGAAVLHGFDVSSSTNELWSWDGATWQLMSSTVGGPGFGSFRLLAVPGGGLMLVGQGWSSSLLETWSWQGGGWTPEPTPPVAHDRFDATADPVTGAPVVAGYPTGGTTMSVHSWTGTGWNLVGTNGPDLGSRFRIANDGAQIVAFGGIHYGTPNVLHGETWVFANGAFTQLGMQPPGGMDPLSACFDEVRRVTVLVGNTGLQIETWEWDGASFRRVHTQPGFAAANLVFDRGRGVTVQHRGDGTTSEWNGTTWVTTVPAGVGPVRYGAGLAYDGQRVILFGGSAVGPYGNETWTYDGVAWSQLAPASSPPTGLYAPLLAEDRRRGVVVMVPSLHGALYEWNGTTWSPPIVVPALATRQDFFVGFHAARGRVVYGAGQQVVFSPYWQLTDSLNVWEWDGATATPLANVPVVRRRGLAVREPDGDLLLAGGYGSSFQVHDSFVAMRSTLPASVRTFGDGCAGTAGVPRLGAEPWFWPWTNDLLQMECSDLVPTATSSLWLLGVSSAQDAFGPLPRDLAFAGAPGCWQRVAPDLAWMQPASQGSSSWSVFVPPGLVGLRLYAQVLSFDAGANPAGFVLSDAAEVVVGQR